MVSFLQTPRVKGQLEKHNLHFLQLSIDQGAGTLGWAAGTHLRLRVQSTDLYLGGKFLPPMRPLPAALRSCSAHKNTMDEATVKVPDNWAAGLRAYGIFFLLFSPGV